MEHNIYKYIIIIHGTSLVRGCKPVPTTGMLTEIAQVAYNSLLHSLRQCGKLGTMTEPSIVQAQPRCVGSTWAMVCGHDIHDIVEL